MPVHQRSKARQTEIQRWTPALGNKEMGYLLLETLTTLEMIISPIAIFLSRHLEASSSALGKSPSPGESNTLASAHSSSRTAKHAIPQCTRWHSSKAASPQFSREGCDLRSQTCCCARRRTAPVPTTCERSRCRRQVCLIESERRDGRGSWDGSEARCPPGARGCAHVARSSWSV
jgi:hypothetical protein